MKEEETVHVEKEEAPRRSRRRTLAGLAEREQDPIFQLGMAALFFDRSPEAFRAMEAAGYFVDLQGSPVGTRRTKGERGDRRYSLLDLRYIAHSFRKNNVIGNDELAIVLWRLDAFKEPLKYHRWYEGSPETKRAKIINE